MIMNKKKVLVVDDDEVHLYATKELLQDEHCEVITHKSGFGVTNVVKMLQSDLVLLEINMPGLSGDDLASLLRANAGTNNTVVIFYSANDEDSLRVSVTRHGVKDYICKGNIPDLRKKVRLHLNIPETASSKVL